MRWYPAEEEPPAEHLRNTQMMLIGLASDSTLSDNARATVVAVQRRIQKALATLESGIRRRA